MMYPVATFMYLQLLGPYRVKKMILEILGEARPDRIGPGPSILCESDN